MLKVLNCVVQEHDLRLVAMSAIICVLGCFTTTSLLARAGASRCRHPNWWIVAAAAVFGSSVWSLHFVAMLAFMPGTTMGYEIGMTALSIVIAMGGALAAFQAYRAPLALPLRAGVSGLLLGFAVSGMHYVGVAAMTFSGFLLFNQSVVAVSLILSAVISITAMARANDLKTSNRRLEVSGWLALAICGLHFTGMSAITMAPGKVEPLGGTLLGTNGLAIAVGCVSLSILLTSMVAMMLEQHLSQRAMNDLGRMRLLSNLAQEALFIHRDGVVLEVNSAGERMFKASSNDIIGSPLLSLFPADVAPTLMRREQCPPLERRPDEMDIRTRDGTRVVVELSCQPIDYLGRPATAVALRDLTDRKRDEARIRHLARHDALTDLPNRYNLQERLGIALDAAAKSKGAIAIIYLDLDRFKPVNDLYGHASGDALLIQISKRIRAEMQPADTLARIGGDEFVMVITGDPRPEKVSAFATRIIEILRRPFEIEGRRIEIGASAGVAFYPTDGGNADTLMRAADTAMYRAKEEGRGTLRFYEASMNEKLQARLQLEQELAGAAERGELVLHYQPMVNGATGEMETFEALIRWQHPEHGMIPPLEFIPMAEETGLIDKIGRWVIDTACREAAGWPHPWRISVNVSPRQFRQSDICGGVHAALKANALAPARLVVEVTEGVLIDDAAKAVATLGRLREMGVRIALDDFGTGYSSLSYLQLFKFDKLKIDKSFVQRLGQSDDALTLTRTIVNLGHNLGLQVTAEGVETLAQLAILQTLGCNQIQGYLVARPAPSSAFTELEQARTRAVFVASRHRLSA